jgi:hypothetical protein
MVFLELKYGTLNGMVQTIHTLALSGRSAQYATISIAKTNETKLKLFQFEAISDMKMIFCTDCIISACAHVVTQKHSAMSFPRRRESRKRSQRFSCVKRYHGRLDSRLRENDGVKNEVNIPTHSSELT